LTVPWAILVSPPFLFLGPTTKKAAPKTAGGASLTVTHLRLRLDYTTSEAGAPTRT